MGWSLRGPHPASYLGHRLPQSSLLAATKSRFLAALGMTASKSSRDTKNLEVSSTERGQSSKDSGHASAGRGEAGRAA